MFDRQRLRYAEDQGALQMCTGRFVFIAAEDDVVLVEAVLQLAFGESHSEWVIGTAR